MKLAYENIRVRLGGKEIVKGISLTAEEGMVTGIIGPNGCGKSTLIKTTFGICRPCGGRILADGQDAAGLGAKKLASLIGYVGQDSGSIFDFSVAEVVSMAMYARKDKSRPGKEVVRQALEELKLSHLSERSILSLSGGERKLVFIARAIALGADTLILDEPTNHLDIRHQLFLMEYLKKKGRTVLIVLHDLRLASHYCDRIYLLKDGTVAASGSPFEALNRETVRRVFGIWGNACRNQYGQMDFALFSGKEDQEFMDSLLDKKQQE